jgi:hypothetical protein
MRYWIIAPDSQRVKSVLGSTMAGCVSGKFKTSEECGTRNSTVRINIDEWLLLDILEAKAFELVGKVEFFHDENELESNRILLVSR